MKFRKLRLSVLFAILFIFTSTVMSQSAANDRDAQAISGQIYLIGLNATGGPAIQAIDAEAFRQSLATVFSAVQDSLLPKLDAAPATPSPMEMRTVGVGIGLTGQIGLGPLFHISLNPRVRLVFSNSKTPVYPQ